MRAAATCRVCVCSCGTQRGGHRGFRSSGVPSSLVLRRRRQPGAASAGLRRGAQGQMSVCCAARVLGGRRVVCARAIRWRVCPCAPRVLGGRRVVCSHSVRCLVLLCCRPSASADACFSAAFHQARGHVGLPQLELRRHLGRPGIRPRFLGHGQSLRGCACALACVRSCLGVVDTGRARRLLCVIPGRAQTMHVPRADSALALTRLRRTSRRSGTRRTATSATPTAAAPATVTTTASRKSHATPPHAAHAVSLQGLARRSTGASVSDTVPCLRSRCPLGDACLHPAMPGKDVALM